MIYVSFDIGIKNLALCILEDKGGIVSILDWRIITLANTKKEIKSINDIADRIYFELDALMGNLKEKGYDKIEKVIIENQPSNLNGIMKTIQHLIFSYFNLLRHWENIISDVILINASHKLQNHSYIPPSKEEKEKKEKIARKDKYKLNKSDAIEVCRYYIKDNEVLLNFFNSNKKKDDLSDSCIQVVSYIRKNGNLVEQLLLSDSHLLDL